MGQVRFGYEPSDNHDKGKEELKFELGPDDFDIGHNVAPQLLHGQLVARWRDHALNCLAYILELQEPIAANYCAYIDKKGWRKPGSWLSSFKNSNDHWRLCDQTNGSDQWDQVEKVPFDAKQHIYAQTDVGQTEKASQTSSQYFVSAFQTHIFFYLKEKC